MADGHERGIGAQVHHSFIGNDRTYDAPRVWQDALEAGGGCGSMIAQLTAHPVTGELTMASWRRGRPEALMHRSDPGSQYTSESLQRLLKVESTDMAAAS